MRSGFRCAALAVVGLALMMGCSKKEDPQCAAQVAGLRAWVADLDKEGGGFYGEFPPVRGKLVSVDDRADLTEDAPSLTINGGIVLVNGSPVGNTRSQPNLVEGLRDDRRQRRELWEQTHPGQAAPDSPSLLALFAATDEWTPIATTLDAAARAGYSRVTFVFDAKTKLSPPPATPVSVALLELEHGEKVDPSQKARILAESRARETPAGRAFHSCPEIGEKLSPLGEMAIDARDKQLELDRRVPDGILACGCKVDMNEVKAVFWSQYGRFGGTPKAGDLVTLAPHDGAAGVTELAAPSSQSWADVAPRVIAASRAGQTSSFAIGVTAD
jgi:hypothetical protein